LQSITDDAAIQVFSLVLNHFTFPLSFVVAKARFACSISLLVTVAMFDFVVAVVFAIAVVVVAFFFVVAVVGCDLFFSIHVTVALVAFVVVVVAFVIVVEDEVSFVCRVEVGFSWFFHYCCFCYCYTF